MLRIPNAVGQTAIFVAGTPDTLDVSSGSALAGMTDVLTEAAASGWANGDYLTVRYAASDNNYAIALARLETDTLAIVTVLKASGSIATGAQVDVLVVPVEQTLSPLSGVFDAALFGLQGALDAANAAGGGVVAVGSGVWTITETLLIYSNTTLRLQPDTVIRRGAHINCMIRNGTTGVTGYTGDHDILIEGGTWDGNKTLYASNVCLAAFGHAKNVTLKNASFIDPYGWHCVELNGVDAATVDGCRFSGLSTTDKELLQIDLMLSSAQYPWETSFDSLPCRKITITNCAFTDGSRAIGTHSSASGVTHDGILISGCTIDTMSQEGIYGLNWQDVVISGNYITSAVKGVVLTGSNVATLSGFSIVGNTLEDMTTTDGRGINILGMPGVKLTMGVIANNTLRTVGCHGIGVDYSERWTVSNNVITGVDRVSIWLFVSNHCVVIGNIITGVGSFYTPKRGIQIGSSSGAAADTAYNLVVGNNTEAIITDYADRTIIENNVITTTLTNGASATNTQMARNFVGATWTP